MGLISEIAEEINEKSKGYKVGELQHLRKQVKGMKQLPGTAIFSKQTIFDREEFKYAFHHGVRAELQFNIGIEEGPSEVSVRVRHS